MNDSTTTIEAVKKLMKAFVQERDWQQFHTPKNLSMDIAVEASELMEYFLWVDSSASYVIKSDKREGMTQEVADIFMALICFCNVANIDLSVAFERKLKLTKEKYPVEKVKGKAIKYTDL